MFTHVISLSFFLTMTMCVYYQKISTTTDNNSVANSFLLGFSVRILLWCVEYFVHYATTSTIKVLNNPFNAYYVHISALVLIIRSCYVFGFGIPFIMDSTIDKYITINHAAYQDCTSILHLNFPWLTAECTKVFTLTILNIMSWCFIFFDTIMVLMFVIAGPIIFLLQRVMT